MSAEDPGFPHWPFCPVASPHCPEREPAARLPSLHSPGRPHRTRSMSWPAFISEFCAGRPGLCGECEEAFSLSGGIILLRRKTPDDLKQNSTCWWHHRSCPDFRSCGKVLEALAGIPARAEGSKASQNTPQISAGRRALPCSGVSEPTSGPAWKQPSVKAASCSLRGSTRASN